MYSPKFSDMACVSVRRLAWAFGLPMTQTVDHIVEMLISQVDRKTVCESCKDKSKCSKCVFSKPGTSAATLALFAAT